MINFTIIENQIKEFEKALADEMDKAIKHFEHELVAIRTGRAHTSIVEDIKVTCYGGASELSLKEVSSISAPDACMIIIQPWDKSIINDIERAILQSNIGVTPVNDGDLIRIALPQMSTSRRDELVKTLHKKLEECRVSCRNVRRDFHNLVRDAQKAKKISQDFHNRLEDSLQKVTDQFIKKAETMSSKKEATIRG